MELKENHALKMENLSLYTSYGDIFLQSCNIEIKENDMLLMDNFISIETMEYLGSYHISKNKQCILTWDENHGLFLLIKDRHIILKGILQCPYRAHVSSEGKISITDNLITVQYNRFYVIYPDGQIIISAKYLSNIGGVATSDDGTWAMCQTYKSEFIEHSNKIFLYDIYEGQIASSFSREVEISKKCELDTEKGELHLLYENSCQPFKILRYTFYGELLDRDIWNKYCEDKASGFDLSVRASNLLKDISSNEFSDYAEPFRLLSLSLQRHTSPGTKAYIFKYLGDIHLKCQIIDKAIMFYEESLKYNSKMPIKRILKKMKQSLNDKTLD